MQSDFSRVLLIRVLLCADNRCHPASQAQMKLGVPQWDSNTPAIALRIFSELPRITKPTPNALNGMHLSDERGGDWSSIIFCLDETMKYGPGWWHVNIKGGKCTDSPRFLFNPVSFKMIALVTFSLAVCQPDMAILPLSSLSCWVSFILKHHFTHGWL